MKDQYGNSLIGGNANQIWHSTVEIMLDNEGYYSFSKSLGSDEAKARTIVHEVGHALKLEHPHAQNNYVPVSIMCQQDDLQKVYERQNVEENDEDTEGKKAYLGVCYPTGHDKAMINEKWGSKEE